MPASSFVSAESSGGNRQHRARVPHVKTPPSVETAGRVDRWGGESLGWMGGGFDGYDRREARLPFRAGHARQRSASRCRVVAWAIARNRPDESSAKTSNRGKWESVGQGRNAPGRGRVPRHAAFLAGGRFAARKPATSFMRACAVGGGALRAPYRRLGVCDFARAGVCGCRWCTLCTLQEVGSMRLRPCGRVRLEVVHFVHPFALLPERPEW